MIFDNPRFVAFREALQVRGYDLQNIWTASDGIHIFAVATRMSDTPRPVHSTIVVRDYEDHGFGVWLESRTGSYAAGAEEIITGIAKEDE